jgi:Cof subfamily protein (haloacid dehalogenase superfamily)
MTEKRQIKLIVMDVDGTLVDDNKDLPAVNRRALEAAVERGLKIAIGSGRMIPSIETVQERIGLDCAIIAYNGGKVVGLKEAGRPVVSHRPVPAEIAERVLDLARELGHCLNFYVEDRLFADEAHRDQRLPNVYAGRTGSFYEHTDLDAYRGTEPTKLIILADPDERDRLFYELTPKWAGEINIQRTDPEYLEFMAPGVDKATALPALAGYFGFDVSEVLAIGDADNDVRMVETAGIGVAVNNARQTVLDVADHRTERDNNNGAVAEAIEKFAIGEPVPGLWD